MTIPELIPAVRLCHGSYHRDLGDFYVIISSRSRNFSREEIEKGHYFVVDSTVFSRVTALMKIEYDAETWTNVVMDEIQSHCPGLPREWLKRPIFEIVPFLDLEAGKDYFTSKVKVEHGFYTAYTPIVNIVVEGSPEDESLWDETNTKPRIKINENYTDLVDVLGITNE